VKDDDDEENDEIVIDGQSETDNDAVQYDAKFQHGHANELLGRFVVPDNGVVGEVVPRAVGAVELALLVFAQDGRFGAGRLGSVGVGIVGVAMGVVVRFAVGVRTGSNARRGGARGVGV
jgi:hypothetical protein